MGSVYKRGGKKSKGNYQISWIDWTPNGPKPKSMSARTTDKSTAEQILRKKEAEAALRREGVYDPRLEELRDQRQRKLSEHLTDYENELRTSKRSDDHIQKTLGFIRECAGACGWAGIGEIGGDSLNRYAAERLESVSARTVQATLTAAKSFTRWLARTGKLSHDPLANVKKPNPKHDRRHERRALLPDEWPLLLQAARDGRPLGGMTGEERALLYRTAIETGLRASELESLRRSDLHLDARRPTSPAPLTRRRTADRHGNTSPLPSPTNSARSWRIIRTVGECFRRAT